MDPRHRRSPRTHHYQHYAIRTRPPHTGTPRHGKCDVDSRPHRRSTTPPPHRPTRHGRPHPTTPPAGQKVSDTSCADTITHDPHANHTRRPRHPTQMDLLDQWRSRQPRPSTSPRPPRTAMRPAAHGTPRTTSSERQHPPMRPRRPLPLPQRPGPTRPTLPHILPTTSPRIM